MSEPKPELPIVLAIPSSGVCPAGVHDAHANSKVRRRRPLDRERHQGGGVLAHEFQLTPKSLLLLTLPALSKTATLYAPGLIRAEGLFDREQETSALGHDQQVSATSRLGDMSF